MREGAWRAAEQSREKEPRVASPGITSSLCNQEPQLQLKGSEVAKPWDSVLPGEPQSIWGAARDLFPSLFLQEVQILYTLQLHNYPFTRDFLHTWAGSTGWELRCLVGQHSFWICSSYILQKGWLQDCLLHMYPHARTRTFLCVHMSIFSSLVLLE